MEKFKTTTNLISVLVFLVCLSQAVEAAFLDDFSTDTSADYNDSNSFGSGGSFTISGGKLNITTGTNNTFSVITSGTAEFDIGATLSLEVPPVSGPEGVFMVCSTTAAQPNDLAGTFGFRFRRDLGTYARMHLYPGGLEPNTLDPDPNKPATLCVKRTSDTGFDYSIKIAGNETALGSFTLSELAGIINLHIGAQAYDNHIDTFSFDNLKVYGCGSWGYHPMDFNRDCRVNMSDFAMFADGWMDCTMPGETGCFEMLPFSIVVLPDTQVYSKNEPNIFTQMTTWIVENVEQLNIKFVLHMGDIVNNDDEPTQWANADEAMSILDGNVPYSLVVGNHDMPFTESNGVPYPTRETNNFNNTFPYARYENEPWYGGRMEDPNDDFYEPNGDGFDPNDDYDNVYHYFNAAGMDFLVLALEVGPTDKILKWADSVISGHPNHRVILTTHSYMHGSFDGRDDANSGNWLPEPYCPKNDVNCIIDVNNICSNTGENIWDKLVKCHDNIDFVFSGHRDPFQCPTCMGFLESTGNHGNSVYQFLCGEWKDGWLWTLTFVPEEDRIYTNVYSPWLDSTDPNHQFDLPYDMD